ncbi:Transcription factor HES-1-B, partial [Trichinella patagoniensis]
LASTMALVFQLTMFSLFSMAKSTPKTVTARRIFYETTPFEDKSAQYATQCYSCMSTLYENLWYESGISLLYKKPESFTSYCDQDRFDSRKVLAKPCSDHCIIIENENVIFGNIRRTYMRGCLSDIINYNMTTISYLNHRHKCLTIPMRYLFMGSYRSVQNQPLRICACFTGHCNGSSAVSIYEGKIFPNVPQQQRPTSTSNPSIVRTISLNNTVTIPLTGSIVDHPHSTHYIHNIRESSISLELSTVTTSAVVSQWSVNSHTFVVVVVVVVSTPVPVRIWAGANKPLMEKRRRARINRSLDELKSMLICSTKPSIPGHSKWEKADILEMTVQQMRTLRTQTNNPCNIRINNHTCIYDIAMFCLARDDPIAYGQFISGYTHCIRQLQRFLISSNGTFAPETCRDLIENLMADLRHLTNEAGQAKVQESSSSSGADSVSSLELASCNDDNETCTSQSSPSPPVASLLGVAHDSPSCLFAVKTNPDCLLTAAAFPLIHTSFGTCSPMTQSESSAFASFRSIRHNECKSVTKNASYWRPW